MRMACERLMVRVRLVSVVWAMVAWFFGSSGGSFLVCCNALGCVRVRWGVVGVVLKKYFLLHLKLLEIIC